jgi:2,4-dienoyl-CoA reductase-like NADH-dependent reductase (Old Yellow Enzyme family)
MSPHESFSFQSADELLEKARELGVELPYQESLSSLFESISVGTTKVPNRLVIQPMEGFDGTAEGAPDELTFRRYKRYARGGSGLIWFEATAVVPEGRSNPNQMMLLPATLDVFKSLLEKTRETAIHSLDSTHEVYCVLQITHSGRFSQPSGKPEPWATCFNPVLDRSQQGVHVASDDELLRLKDVFIDAAQLAFQAGFDAVDVKACHGYLVNDLLAAYTRKSSRFGETFEKRVSFILDIVKGISESVPRLGLAVRLNASDYVPYPYGFGMSKESSGEADFSEPLTLVKQLIDSGCLLFNITLGNPRFTPHFGRPFDRPAKDAPLPDEHPLVGVVRLLKTASEFQIAFPDTPFVSTGYSWLRHFFPHVGSAMVGNGETSFVGLGRSSFAYPDATRDLMNQGALDPQKTCITCSRCSELISGGYPTGCVIRDSEIYGPHYQKFLEYHGV